MCIYIYLHRQLKMNADMKISKKIYKVKMFEE